MTTRNRNHTLRSRARILAALGVTSLALVAASPANAMYRGYEPTDGDAPVTRSTAESGNTTAKGCQMVLYGPDGKPGQSVVYPDGYSFSVKNVATGKTHTYTCVNGTWVETVSSTTPSGGYKYAADWAYLESTGQVALENAYEYTYEPNSGSYSQP